MKIRIDPDRCQGHSRCYGIAPDLFAVDEYGTASVRHDGDVPPDLEEAARLAVRNCPEHAIGVVAR
ncbi:MAG: ferredoxin [Ilumatobacteraceae bacterium]